MGQRLMALFNASFDLPLVLSLLLLCCVARVH